MTSYHINIDYFGKIYDAIATKTFDRIVNRNVFIVEFRVKDKIVYLAIGTIFDVYSCTERMFLTSNVGIKECPVEKGYGHCLRLNCLYKHRYHTTEKMCERYLKLMQTLLSNKPIIKLTA